MRFKRWISLALVLVVLLFSYGCSGRGGLKAGKENQQTEQQTQIPPFSQNAFIFLNDNVPKFSAEEMVVKAYEYYSELDELGRCGYAMACLGRELMPTEERGDISHIKPTGWKQAQYNIVDAGNLYNRCHLIGFQLSGENDNEKNLITGTRFLNMEGMLPFENMMADYIYETNNHIIYRVTPIFEGDNLLANGVQMEAKSVEDDGEGVCFNVYVYNSQPGITINYKDGASRLATDDTPFTENTNPLEGDKFILNTSSLKFHTATCSQGETISSKNRKEYIGSRQALIDDGYVPAKCCNP